MARKATTRDKSLTFFRLAGSEFAVLAIPNLPQLPAGLTAAERAVVAMLFAGKSNAEIARARGVSIRTVANQVASVLKKLRVGSRSALIAKLASRAR